MAVDEVRATYVTSEGAEICRPLARLDAQSVVEGLPVREFPVYKGRRSYSGCFWSATMGRHVVYESLLELSWLWLADFDSAITGIAAQPLVLQGTDDGRQRTRYPDFLCLTSEAPPLVVDVKQRDVVAEPDVRAALAWTEQVVRSRGWRYQVWTGADATVLRNVQMIAAGRRIASQTDSVHSVAEHLADGPARFEELEARLTGHSTPRLLVLAGLWHGIVRCDMSAPIRSDSILEVA